MSETVEKRPRLAKSKYKNGHYCCVEGCHSRTGREDIGFFTVIRRFEEQTILWIDAINRINPDGSPWEPTKNTKICGFHFISGKPGTARLDPDYVPTLFLPGSSDSLKSKEKLIKAKERFERVNFRKTL